MKPPLQLALGAALALALATAGAAEPYPSRPIRIVIPYAAGGAGDVVLRKLQPYLEKRLGQPLVFDYKSGAGGNIGTQEVVRAQPDGYTLLLGATNNFVINQFLYTGLGFDPLADLAPISRVADIPSVIYSNPSVAPHGRYAEFAAYARAHPGKMNYGSPGTGTAPHLSAFMLSQALGANMTHIAYRGSPPGVQALMANDAQLYLGGYTVAAGLLGTGRVVALAVAAPQRLRALPDVPTTAEAGVPDVILSNWWGLAAPKGTPRAIVDRLAHEIEAVLAEPAVQREYDENGWIATHMTPDQFGEALRKEAQAWKKIVAESGVQL